MSVDDVSREGNLGLAASITPFSTCDEGVEAPLLVAGGPTEPSGVLTPSLVENIRVNRFVIDGFSVVSRDCAVAESGCGAALSAAELCLLPRLFWPVCDVDVELEDIEDVIDTAGDGVGFSCTRREVVTAAMAGLTKLFGLALEMGDYLRDEDEGKRPPEREAGRARTKKKVLCEM